MSYTEVARLIMKKDNGGFTKKEVETALSNFLLKVFKAERIKMMAMSAEVKFCPMYSQMAAVPDSIQGIKPIGITGICFKEKCGWWLLCPANSESAILKLMEKL